MSSRTVQGTSPAHLGATLRSVLIAPTAGFESALRAADRRARVGASPAEGVAPYLLSAAGGAMLFLLWLKVSALVGMRDGSAETYRWGFLVAAAVTGAVFALVVQFVWSIAGGRLAGPLGSEAASRDLRLVWGASLFPQMVALVLLLPFDLVIVGPSTFTNARPEDPVSAAWASLSVALGVALAIWSIVLLIKGVQTAARSTIGIALTLTALAFASTTLIVLTTRALAILAIGDAAS